jgi:hypothetical protein
MASQLLTPWIMKLFFRGIGTLIVLLSGLSFAFEAGLCSAKEHQTSAGAGTSGADGSHRQGRILVSVTFSPDGAVAACKVVRSNAPFALEANTVDHIRKHWNCPFLGGVTEVIPIVFEESPKPGYWDADMTPPPDLFPSDDQTHSVTLRLTFGHDGWVSDVSIITPSGSDSVDQQTAIWIKAHWHHDAYANQVIDAPFEFKPAPPRTVPKPAQPAKAVAPSEPAPIPAIRAQ